MAASVTEDWEDRTMSQTPDGWVAQRGFMVFDQSDEFGDNEDQIIAEVGIDINDDHPRSNRLKARRLFIGQRLSLKLWKVLVEYLQPQNERDFSERPEDPTAEPISVEWQFGEETVEFDRDDKGSPIVNSAGDPFSPPLTRDDGPAFLVLKRTELGFDPAFAARMRNLINDGVFKIKGRTFAGKLEARIKSIEPVSEFTIDVDFIRVAYTFEMRPNFVVSGKQISGHHARVQDQGLYVLTKTENEDEFTKKKILDANGDPISVDAPLNGKGGEHGTTDGDKRLKQVLATEVTKDATWLYYQKYPQGSYSKLRF